MLLRSRIPSPFSLSEHPIIFFFDGAKDDITEYNTTHKVQLIALKGD